MTDPIKPIVEAASRNPVVAAKLLAATSASLAFLLALVSGFEGTRTKAYQDSVGVWTICTGHTAGVKRGDIATPAQCQAWLEEDLKIAAKIVDKCITVPLTEGQRFAFISATFNIGPKVVCGSTLQRKANKNDLEGACKELTNAKNKFGDEMGWTYAGGVRLKGLITRREAERKLCWPGPAVFTNVKSGVYTTALKT